MSKTNNKTTNITTNSTDTYQITLKENASTGYKWIYKCNHPETTQEISREYLINNPDLIGSASDLIITFKSAQPDLIKFYRVRPWLNNDFEKMVPDYQYMIFIL